MEIVVVAVHDLSRMSSLGGIRASKPKGSNNLNNKPLLMPSFARHASVGQYKRCRLFTRFFCDDKGMPLPPTPLDKSSKGEGERLLVPLGRDPNWNVGVISFEADGRGPLVSRQHCVLELSWCPPSQRLHSDQWCAIRVCDGNSLNGTFVNNKRLAPGASSQPVAFDPCVSDIPLLTLEFGAGSTLAPGASLSPAGLQLQFQVFSRCLQKNHVEWIEHRLGGEAFAVERVKRVRNKKGLARISNSECVNTPKNSSEDDGFYAFLSPRKLKPSVAVNGLKNVQTCTRQMDHDVLGSKVYTRTHIKSKGLKTSTTLRTPQNPSGLLAAVEVTEPNDSATAALDTKENLTLETCPENYADSCAHANPSNIVLHDVVKVEGEIGPLGDDGPVLVVRKRPLTDSPKVYPVSQTTQSEFPSQQSEKSGGVDTNSIEMQAERSAHLDTDSLSCFLSQEDRLTVALPRRGEQNVHSHENNDTGSAIFSPHALVMLPQSEKHRTKEKPIALSRNLSTVTSADARSGTATNCSRMRRREKTNATETIARFVAELQFSGKAKESRGADSDLPKDDKSFGTFRNTPRSVLTGKTGTKRVPTAPTISPGKRKRKKEEE